MRLPRILVFLALLPFGAVASGYPGSAIAEGGLAVTGNVDHPLQLSADEVRHMPPVTEDVSFEAHQQQQKATFTGASLWAVLAKAGIVDGQAKGAHLNHAIVVKGQDGYAVTLAIGEIDPDFEGKSVIVAYERDGKPLDNGELQLVVPGDHKGGRMVHGLASIEVR